MELLFWLCTSIILYVYIGYPIILAIIASLKQPRTLPDVSDWPRLTLIVSAYNESAVIAEKIRNALALIYPPDKLEIIVVSDCSDDGTDDIVAATADARVRLLRMSERRGKSAGLNAAVKQAEGDVLVLTDANAMFDEDALTHLARPFADPRVGVVTGEQRYHPANGDASQQEGLYWRYELMIKRLESQAASLVGGDGAIMAIRKTLYRPLDDADLSDFLLPLCIVGEGYRSYYEPLARCYEHGTDDYDKEFARKVRIVNRAWRATMKMKHLLNPLVHGWFSVQLLSHKLLRWLIGLFLICALVANLMLAGSGWIYSVSLAIQLSFYGLALYGMLSAVRAASRSASIAYYFCLVNFAGLRGIYDNYRGRTYATWAPARQPTSRS